ncbi:MAG TPA: hypothetical protein VF407_20800 [Polyangiaceae bacterium]
MQNARGLLIGAAIAVAALGGGMLACNAILGLGDYQVVDGGVLPGQDGGPNPGGDCGVASADGPCYACDPSTDIEFLNACTDSTCVPFDDKTRIPNFDASLPDIPEPTPDGG